MAICPLCNGDRVIPDPTADGLVDCACPCCEGEGHLYDWEPTPLDWPNESTD